MNILIISKFYADSFAQHQLETLLAMGHQVEALEYGWQHQTGLFSSLSRYEALYTKTSIFERSLLKKVLHIMEQKNINIILTTHDYLSPVQVTAIKKQHKNIKIALWFPDHLGSFQRAMFFNAGFDALFFKDSYIVHTLREQWQKSNVFYLPECCNPLKHKTLSLEKTDFERYTCDITTAGNLHPFRIMLFEKLVSYKVKIWGYAPPTWADAYTLRGMIMKKYVANEEKAKAFLAAKIVLNNLYPSEIWGTNARTFEAASIGAFQLVNWRPHLHTFFEENSEIVSFKTIPELLEKIDFFLENDSRRHDIAQAAQARAHREHTYAHRLQCLLDTLAGNATGYPMPPVPYSTL